ncbi:MAG: hypothetical protein QM811_08660, partial [Pirellulales bacterium]
ADAVEMQDGFSWHVLAAKVLAGHQTTDAEALAILRSSDDELLDLVAAAHRLRRAHFGKTVQLYFLMNAKSGLCAEDCGYCSQAKDSEAEIPTYNFLSTPKILEGARRAAEQRAKTYCIVISGRADRTRDEDRHDAGPANQRTVRPEHLRLPGLAG